MKKVTLILTAATVLLLTVACTHNGDNVKLTDQQDTLSWAMGRSLAQTAQSGFYDFDVEMVLKGFQSAMDGKGEKILDEQAYQEALNYLSFLAEAKQHQAYKEQQAQMNVTQEELFAKVAQQPNIKKGPEGIYYEVLREGKGPKAIVGKRVKFDFKASLMTTGEVFEQTYGQRDPIVHVVGNPMTKGILLALQQMNAGSKYRFYIPYELMANGQGVPSLTPVVYEIELHEIFEN